MSLWLIHKKQTGEDFGVDLHAFGGRAVFEPFGNVLYWHFVDLDVFRIIPAADFDFGKSLRPEERQHFRR